MGLLSWPLGLAARIGALAVLLALEALVLSTLFDGGTRAPSGAWLTQWVHDWGPRIARSLMGFAVIFATFAGLRYKSELAPVSDDAVAAPFRLWPLALH